MKNEMNMTYRELLAALSELNDTQLDTTVTVYSIDSDEYVPSYRLALIDVTDVLDEGHPVIVVP
jgi:hypothetical protein